MAAAMMLALPVVVALFFQLPSKARLCRAQRIERMDEAERRRRRRCGCSVGSAANGRGLMTQIYRRDERMRRNLRSTMAAFLAVTLVCVVGWAIGAKAVTLSSGHRQSQEIGSPRSSEGGTMPTPRFSRWNPSGIEPTEEVLLAAMAGTTPTSAPLSTRVRFRSISRARYLRHPAWVLRLRVRPHSEGRSRCFHLQGRARVSDPLEG